MVGLVRSAASVSGVSCRLSGGSQCLSAVTSSSKYREISPAQWSRNSRSDSEGGCFPLRGRLMAQQRAGVMSHSTPRAFSTTQGQRKPVTAAAIQGHMRMKWLKMPQLYRLSPSEAVTQASICRWLTRLRYSAKRIALPCTQAR